MKNSTLLISFLAYSLFFPMIVKGQVSAYNPFVCGKSSIKDIDLQTYKTVLIGTQCWMKENLRVTRYGDGTQIPLDGSGSTTGNGTGETWSTRNNGARTVYAHNPNNLMIYGYLYNWYVLSNKYKLCPKGWHVPTDSEWATLISFLSGEPVAGGKLKATGTTLWLNPNAGAVNSSGFSALPGGYRKDDGNFNSISSNAFFWSATERSNVTAWNYYMDYNSSFVNKFNADKKIGAYVRCLMD